MTPFKKTSLTVNFEYVLRTGRAVTVNSLHPGAVYTEFGRFSSIVSTIMTILVSFLKVCAVQLKALFNP